MVNLGDISCGVISVLRHSLSRTGQNEPSWNRVVNLGDISCGVISVLRHVQGLSAGLRTEYTISFFLRTP